MLTAIAIVPISTSFTIKVTGAGDGAPRSLLSGVDIGACTSRVCDTFVGERKASLASGWRGTRTQGQTWGEAWGHTIGHGCRASAVRAARNDGTGGIGYTTLSTVYEAGQGYCRHFEQQLYLQSSKIQRRKSQKKWWQLMEAKEVTITDSDLLSTYQFGLSQSPGP